MNGRVGAASRLAVGLATLLLIGLVGGSILVGHLAGWEPRSAWICDDTRYTQLVPRGRTVVGGPVSPAPGCRP